MKKAPNLKHQPRDKMTEVSFLRVVMRGTCEAVAGTGRATGWR